MSVSDVVTRQHQRSTSRRQLVVAASPSPFHQSSSARGAASPSQHVRSSGRRSGWSDVLELIAEQSPRVGV